MNRFQEPRGGLQGHWNDARGAPKDREASTPPSCDVPKGTGRSFGPEFQQPANRQALRRHSTCGLQSSRALCSENGRVRPERQRRPDAWSAFLGL